MLLASEDVAMQDIERAKCGEAPIWPEQAARWLKRQDEPDAGTLPRNGDHPAKLKPPSGGMIWPRIFPGL